MFFLNKLEILQYVSEVFSIIAVGY